jgi:hypothetical protein
MPLVKVIDPVSAIGIPPVKAALRAERVGWRLRS